ncbi:MAG TPA: hypothetical protein VGG85_17975 [Terracidiphilus sp.]|jgi:hypothetical protein
MNRRLLCWALAGFVVASFWVIFAYVTFPRYNFGHWVVTQLSAPASLIGQHRPTKWYTFIALNTAIYALAGLAAESLRLLPRRSVR